MFMPFNSEQANIENKKSIIKDENITKTTSPEKKNSSKIKTEENLSIKNNWEIIIKRLEIDSITRNLANNITFYAQKDEKISFHVNKNLESVVTDRSKAKLKEALSNYFKKDIDIIINTSSENLSTLQKKNEESYNNKILDANKKIDDDDFIKTIKEKFNAQSIENSVQIDEQTKGE